MKWNIACVQMDIAFGNRQKNYETVEKMIEQAIQSKPDVIVLPELWTTGYDLTRLAEIGDVEANDARQFLCSLAKKHQVHLVAGSVDKKTEEGIFNTMLIITKEGKCIKQYDKLHLFKLMDEHLYLQPGKENGLFTLDDISCAGFICYDIRFPEWLRAHTAKGAEIIFVSAEWPKPRLDHWRSLLISRAIENQAYVVAVNRSGSDLNNVFAGHSMIIDPWGAVISEAGEDIEILTGTLDLAKVSEVRGRIPVFSDRRPEFYKEIE